MANMAGKSQKPPTDEPLLTSGLADPEHRLSPGIVPANNLAAKLLADHNNNLEQAIQSLRVAYAAHKTSQTPKHTSTEVVIQVTDVAKQYKIGKTKVDALRNANVTVYKGEFIAITGTSGSGKSTLLHLMGGLDKPGGGTITVNGQDLAKLRDARLSSFRNRTIGFVFQFFYLQPFLRLQTNVEVPAMFARTKRANRHQHSAELTNNVGLSDRITHLPRELSGGQMQRAAIARALMNQPDILLADEPTGNLDRTNALAIFELFRTISKEQGTTIVVVTHDLELANLADRVVHMSDGATE